VTEQASFHLTQTLRVNVFDIELLAGRLVEVTR
jgi:hypothetical protein